MEVSVTESSGVPEGCLLSIRAGMTRRQAQLPVTEPLRFPNLPVNAKQFKVDLLRSVGSARLDIQAEEKLERYTVHFDLEGGSKATVGLSIQEQPMLCGKRAYELKQLEQTTRHAAGSAAGTQTRSAQDSRGYAEQHNIPNLIQEMLANVLHSRPSAPYSVMAEYLRRHAEGSGERPEAAEGDDDPERLQLEAEHLALLAERAKLRKELAALPVS